MSYVNDTEYACRNLIDLTMREEAELAELKASLKSELQKAQVFKWDFETSDLNDDFSDAYVMNAFTRMAEAEKQASDLKADEAKLVASIGAKQMAVQALAGALLQIVKQGVSLVHGTLGAAPHGRLLDGMALKDIVWQARNQAIHFEEQNFHPAVITVFQQLAQAFGQDFDLATHGGQSRAKQVLMQLGWTNYDNLKNDMQSLGL